MRGVAAPWRRAASRREAFAWRQVEHFLPPRLGTPWRRRAEAARDGALKECAADTATTELVAAMQRAGKLRMENELLRARIERPGHPKGTPWSRRRRTPALPDCRHA